VTHSIDQAIYHVASALEVPVLIAALVALAATLFELGAFGVELLHRRGRDFRRLSEHANEARAALDAGDRDQLTTITTSLAWTAATRETLLAIADDAGEPLAEPRIAKELADFDFASQRRLARTRLLVRVGPALGLMGTLIPLSPALEGLAKGNITELSSDLRVAFSVTVVGLLIGAIAFGISLIRDRIYGQDLSDLEYVAAVLTADEALPPPAKPEPAGRTSSSEPNGAKAAAAERSGATR